MVKWANAKNDLAEILRASWKGVTGVIKTQLILSAITFVMLCIGFLLLDIPLWGLIAFLIALVDMIPVIGSGMVMIPWATIVLITGNRQFALHLLILYAVIFIARQILDPVINGKSIGVKPVYTLLSTVIVTLILGPWGLLLGSVFAVVIKTALDIRARRNRPAEDANPPDIHP